jgi:hypothetical protein
MISRIASGKIRQDNLTDILKQSYSFFGLKKPKSKGSVPSRKNNDKQDRKRHDKARYFHNIL